MTMQWWPIPGLEGEYSISDRGDIRSEARVIVRSDGRRRTIPERVLKLSKSNSKNQPYYRVRLSGGQHRYVHHIVAEVFIGPRPPGMEVLHANDIHTDNRACNLSYGTRSQNLYDAVANGRHQLALRTHCPRNHPYDEQNTRMYQGRRFCRTLQARTKDRRKRGQTASHRREESSSMSTEIEILPPRRPAQSEAIGQLMAHAQAMSAAKMLADELAGTDMVPKDYKNKPGNAAAAILYGAELGLNPIQSLQQIFVVHGSPAIYARTAVALVKRHGVVVETVSSTADAVTVRGTDGRTGQVEQSTWDIARATTAGYTSNAKYRTNPQEMLYAKAAMEVCRKIAPDILLGIPYAREELEMEEAPKRVRSERASDAVQSLRQRAAAQAEVTAAANPEPPQQQGMSAPTRRKWLNRMFALLGEADCTEKDSQLIVIAAVAGLPIGQLEHRDALSDDELRATVSRLNDWEKQGVLGDQIREILNTAALDAAQAATGEQQTIDETN